MGILMLQRDKKWRIEVRETWKIKKVELSDDFEDFLVKHMVKHSIEFTETDKVFKFENSIIEYEDYKEFLITINQLFEYKRKYGQIENG